MNNDSDDGNGNRPSLFPAGLVASPDAKFILEAIDAAVSFVLHDWDSQADPLLQADLLRLVTDRLHPGGALPFLREPGSPWH